MLAEKRTIKRPLASLAILMGVILLTGSLVFSYLNRSIAEPDATRLPKKIAGLSLNTAIYGPEAVEEITRLHGKAFPIASGALGMYGDSNQISIWIAGFTSRSLATQIISAMEEKISLGNSPFTPIDQKQGEGHSIQYLEGMGQKHVYLQSGKLVLWLSADPSVADQAIQQILEEYP